jgi:DNA end-binding protein Ku
MLQPWEKGLMGTTLRYAYEVRPASDYFDDIDDIKVGGEMLKLAEHILDTKKDTFDPSGFVDHYEEAVVKMLQAKQAGLPVPTEKSVEAPKNVINLMDALRKSVANGKGAKPAKGKEAAPAREAAKAAPAKVAAPAAGKAAAKKGKKPVAGQREMLLPIAGKKKEAAKEAAKPAATARRKAG